MHPDPDLPPFSPAEARAARQRIGLTPQQVAGQLTQLGLPCGPQTVLAWESGAAAPSETDLFALADALWCPVAVLMALRPGTLREHRLARQFTRERLAVRIGMAAEDYARAEAGRPWPGSDHQTLLLADALGLAPDALYRILDRDGEFLTLLRAAVEGRWKQYAVPLARLTGAAPEEVAAVLRTLHQEFARFNERYLGHLVARSGDARLREVAADRAAWLRALPERFRRLTGPG
ncbi:helix-turn-helix transcriptional regulator [Streptomyces sp. NPDC046866]|uniref:helix-turn-helix domain-containing protein n=1 Tax=Streptomyces sp. NPDC046866 TaxID=3154921 RepID=UPI0034553042